MLSSMFDLACFRSCPVLVGGEIFVPLRAYAVVLFSLITT